MNIASLSEYVKSMRKEHGLTQVELSEKSGVVPMDKTTDQLK